MKLMTQELMKKVPSLYATENQLDPTIWGKFFTPWTNWTWYVLEFDGRDICYGYVEGHFKELGYFSLKELQKVVGPGGLKVERDRFFEPCPLSTKYREWASMNDDRLKKLRNILEDAP